MCTLDIPYMYLKEMIWCQFHITGTGYKVCQTNKHMPFTNITSGAIMQQHQGIEEFLNVLPKKHSVDLE
jgi:hypothetical protein